MRGSYQWAMLRLAVLAAFVVPAALLTPHAAQSGHAYSWLAAVDSAAPVLALHRSSADNTEEAPVLTVADLKALHQHAALAQQAQQDALRLLRQELARELVRNRLQQSTIQVLPLKS